MILEALAPVGDFERDLAQSIADDGWRLKRARAIEASTFALGLHEHSTDNAGHPEVDAASLKPEPGARTLTISKLLTVYEQRIQRAVDKNLARLKTMQTERKELAAKAMDQAKLLYQLAKARGKPYRPEAFFVTAPEVRESVFSSNEIARELSRSRLLSSAETLLLSRQTPQRTQARTANGGRCRLIMTILNLVKSSDGTERGEALTVRVIEENALHGRSPQNRWKEAV